MSKVKILLSGIALAAFTTTASAAVVCNDEGDCWHVKERHVYKPEWRLRVYEDDWRWKDEDRHRYRWREHDGRGYWRNGIWIEF